MPYKIRIPGKLVQPLDAPALNGTSGAPVVDMLASDDVPVDEQLIAHEERSRLDTAVHRALAALSPRERTIMACFAMSEEQPSLRDLGSQIGVSGERVRQIKLVATAKLRTLLCSYRSEGRYHEPEDA